ncbi:MAG: hypothetical protein U5L45_14765 [Saprospiraceae bacterium]|nr:hypothetical protein [Saprospiraceae bacterium]
MVHFSGFARKMNHIPFLARAKRAREPAVWSCVWFQNFCGSNLKRAAVS